MASMLRHRAVSRGPKESSPTGFRSPAKFQFSPSTKKNDDMPSVFLSENSSYYSLGGGGLLRGGWKPKLLLAAGCLILMAPWLRHARNQWRVGYLRKELQRLKEDHRQLQSRLRTQTSTLSEIKEETEKKSLQNNRLFSKLTRHGDNYKDFNSESYAAAEEMENAYMRRIDEVQQEIQRSSERNLSRQGYSVLKNADIVRIEITLNRNVANLGNTLILEMGSTSLIPHAVNLFVTLANDKKFYDHLTLMYLKGGNMIQMAPMDSETMRIVSQNFVRGSHVVVGSDADKDPAKLSEEDDYLLHSLALLENNDDYPLEKYSVLFTDHGPFFNINMDGNLKEVNPTDVVIGNITEGRAILDYMVEHHSQDFQNMFMIGIEKVRIAQKKEVKERPNSSDRKVNKKRRRSGGQKPRAS